MFKIYDGREHFYQWDIDRKLIVAAAAIKEVHFCNRTGDCSLVCETYVEDGLTLVNVPNILLQTDWKIHVYAYDGYYTKHDDCFDVVSRSKPADYVYTETEVVNYTDLLERLEELEKNGGGGGASIVVDEALDPQSTNPIQNKAVYGAWEDLLNNKVSYTEYEPREAQIKADIAANTKNINTLIDVKAPYGHTHKLSEIDDYYAGDYIKNITLTVYADKAASIGATRQDGTGVEGLSTAIATSDMVHTEIKKVNDKIGDIETATNNIIALQNAYIGGENA